MPHYLRRPRIPIGAESGGRLIFFKKCEGLVVAATLQEMRKSRRNGVGELRLKADDFFGNSLEAPEVGGGVPFPRGMVGDHGKSFAQSAGEGEVWILVFHVNKLMQERRDVTGGIGWACPRFPVPKLQEPYRDIPVTGGLGGVAPGRCWYLSVGTSMWKRPLGEMSSTFFSKNAANSVMSASIFVASVFVCGVVKVLW